MEAAVSTERAGFEQWATRQWNALPVAERARRLVTAHDRVQDRFRDDLGLILLAGASLPGNFSGDEWRELIRELVVEHLWYEWNRIQVVAEGLIGTDDEIDKAACIRLDAAELAYLVGAIERGELNTVVTYHVDSEIAFRFQH